MRTLSRLLNIIFLISFVLLFWMPEAHANTYFTAYYGTTNTTGFNTAAANWVGGTVARRSNGNNWLGTAANLVDVSGSGGDKTFRISPDNGYRIVSISWCEATWWPDAQANHITPGTWDSISGLATNQTDHFDFTISTSNNKAYLLWVVFGPELTPGGTVGAWYGTNNVIGYDTPTADGSGGSVWQISGTDIKLGNRDPNGYHRNSDSTRNFEVRPTNGFRIVSIQYGVTLNPTSWTPVAVSANQTTNVQFSIYLQDNNQYVIWVQFASTAASSFTVTGTVDPASDPACTSNSIAPASRVININQTGDFTLGTSSNCSIDCVTFPTGGACVTWTGTGAVYTTPPIDANKTFTVKFKPIGFTIDAYVDASSPTGSGSIDPTGTAATGTAIQVPQGGSKTFTITSNPGYSVAHVWITDPGRSWVNHDLAPISINPATYTFDNVQANGTIHVQFVQLVPAAGRDYCQIPPFVQGRTDLVPNVMIVFDNSGSMGGTDTDGYAYYNTHSYGCTASHNTTTNKCNTIFHGYFDPYQMYKVDTNANVYLKNNVTLNLAANGLSGNYLNYRYMHKVDVIRKLLVGGRVTGKGTTTLLSSTSGGRADITTNKFLWADIGKWVEYGTTEPTGILQTYASRVRFGLEVFGSTSNSNSDGGTIVARLGTPIADLINKIEGPDTNPKTNTPIAEALYEAIRYFQAKPSAYNNGTNYGDSTEPDGWNAASNPIIQFACQRNFVLLLTDGEANSTDKLPGLSNPSLNSYTDTVFNVNTWVNRITAADKPTSSDGRYSDGVAYMGHVTDLRSSAFGNEMLGNQTITFYTVYAFGDGSGQQTLKTLSKYGGFNSRNGNDAGTDPNKYPSPDDPTEWDLNSDNVPDTYFEGNDGAVIGQNIISALQAMTASVSSGTAASILANSEGTGANLLQAIFYPVKDFEDSTSVAWIGEMHNLWYFIDPKIANSSLREDTDGDKVLKLKSDREVQYVFNGEQTLVNLKVDTDGNGAGDVGAGTAVNPDNVNSIWRAGRLLWARSAADRTIYTPCSIKDASSACLACIGGSCPSGSSNSGMMDFSDSNKSLLGPYLQSADASTTTNIINWVRGQDQGDSYRKRAVARTVGASVVSNEWKLGDIISSTPRLLSNMPITTYDKIPPSGYADLSYGGELTPSGFINSNTYKNRGMVFTGANDGMFHAFKLGKLDVTATDDTRARLIGTDLGEESWAFIPKSTLPYLKYMGDLAYGENFHIMYIDGPTTIVDASIGIPSTCSETTDYWNCGKDTATGTNWRTVVIGSMGTGGATKSKADTTCTNCVKTPIMDPADNTNGFGYSSYFALDVTDPEKPTLLWEFSSPDLGFATSGPAVMRLKAPTDGLANTKNGRWLAVLASGPTGPISDKQFHGRSTQPLKVFVLDLKTGELLGTISSVADGASSSTLNNAFAGSIFTSFADTDRSAAGKSSAGYYQDDVLYIGYTQANSSTIDSTTTWTTGGLLRLITGEKLNNDGSLDLTNGWKLSKVIDNIGPVNSNIGKLYDRPNHNLWLYFGTGRYFDTNDDQNTRQRLFGIKEPCYKAVVNHADSSVTKDDMDDNNCTTKLSRITDLDDQSDSPSDSLSALTDKGWYINLDDKTTDFDAERVLTDPVLTYNGVVYFVTFKPTSDPCSFGGQTNMWGVYYKNGAAPADNKKNDKALLQLSTGSFEGLDLKQQMGAREGRRTTNPLVGKPPSDAPPVISASRNKPVKKILQIREK